MKIAMFERDLLYPTNKQFEPGSVHVTVYQPEHAGRIPVMIRAITDHNPLDYIPDIIGILQADVFDRIRINIRKIGIIYIMTQNGDCYMIDNMDQENFQAKPVSVDAF